MSGCLSVMGSRIWGGRSGFDTQQRKRDISFRHNFQTDFQSSNTVPRVLRIVYVGMSRLISHQKCWNNSLFQV
jgi:hypothetical protein